MTFESWCERDHLIAFDFDPHIVGVAAQPFRFEFTTTADRLAWHTPDYFLRTADGGAVVVDVKPDELISDDDRLKFSGAAVLCDRVGWAYRRLGELPAVWGANLRWLAGYRHARVKDDSVAARALQIVDRGPGITLGELAQEVGHPLMVVSTIFHMFWDHDLITDLARRLSVAPQVERSPCDKKIGPGHLLLQQHAHPFGTYAPWRFHMAKTRPQLHVPADSGA